jgi:hypothetical protein
VRGQFRLLSATMFGSGSTRVLMHQRLVQRRLPVEAQRTLAVLVVLAAAVQV